jgi:glycine amidinotransferase
VSAWQARNHDGEKAMSSQPQNTAARMAQYPPTTETSLDKGPVTLTTSPVCSYNEWDPLEEVIVGGLDGASIPGMHITLDATMPEESRRMFEESGGCPFPAHLIEAGNRDLDRFVEILEGEGVTVRRPERIDHSRPFATPDWSVAGGVYAAMPRDVALVIGDRIIEAPMAWRSRHFEICAFRSLFTDYFRRGARWEAAPRPRLLDDFYDPQFETGPNGRLCITEMEPTFDAADFIRCGRDIFGQRSHVTNALGIEWLRRQLGNEYTVHELAFDDPHPMHIDATCMPLAPGKLLVNPERVREIPPQFRAWDFLYAPRPCVPADHPMFMSSRWISMNLFMLDEHRVVVERDEEPLIRMLKDWGFKPVLCPFRNFNTFGGSFHCATLDVRRRGDLRSYI